MFRSKSAWFSGSVSQACQNFWISEGGIIACWRKADYLFSEDATCPDTLRIFESKDYLWNRVVVFHCLFLSTCEKRQSVKSVSIGHYVLPPASVQDALNHLTQTHQKVKNLCVVLCGTIQRVTCLQDTSAWTTCRNIQVICVISIPGVSIASTVKPIAACHKHKQTYK
ncbi:telomere repeats-binding bouquet formation protein 2 isoform X2 [Larimichthys crocea]|uniref:telomere repeats-binding bouquet formation protein 2 isoform X2 n=1 Tax=Larimichthys crocea TaxID=215358 RepID=UPI000F5F30AA|nr:telomere repeats-binding bouquet formation protein 2 isoform X2 [Larimichthys crocea]